MLDKYLLEFEIQKLPRMINDIGNKHWAVKQNEIFVLHAMVYSAIQGKKPLVPLKKAKLRLVRFSSSEPDGDNLSISFKPIIDALVRQGVLENDKLSNIGVPTYEWKAVPRKQGKISVTVEEV